MSADGSNGRRRLERARAGRANAELVSGLRGLAGRSRGRRPGQPRQESNGGPPRAGAEGEEHCELCGAALPPDHRHLIELAERRIVCACETCWSTRSGDATYRPAGVRVVWLDDLELPDEAWAAFNVPIGLAFFMRTGAEGEARRVVAFYPSPAGATESEIDAEAWARLERINPELENLEPDAEAMIVDRLTETRRAVIAPIDECYKLVGMIRVSWEGLSGGEGPARAIDAFFDQLEVRNPRAGGPPHQVAGADG